MEHINGIPTDSICVWDREEAVSDSSVYLDPNKKTIYKHYPYINKEHISLYHHIHNALTKQTREFQNTLPDIVDDRNMTIDTIFVKVLPLPLDSIVPESNDMFSVTKLMYIPGKTLSDIETQRNRGYCHGLCTSIKLDILNALQEYHYIGEDPIIDSNNIKIRFADQNAYLLVTDIAANIYELLYSHRLRISENIKKNSSKTQEDIYNLLHGEYIQSFITDSLCISNSNPDSKTSLSMNS